MSFSLYVSELSSIFLGLDDSIGSAETSKKFQSLLQNDRMINTLFVNSIGIWQCNWYYDSSVKGYSIGDAVWLNTEEPETFVQTHHTLIKQYTDLNSQILNKLPEWNARNNSVISSYLAAMSGYTDENLGKDVVLPPIYEIGDFSKPIQIAVSLKNNNKDLVSNVNSWKKLFVNSDADGEKIASIVRKHETEKISAHLINYHLSGKEDDVLRILSDFIDDYPEKVDYNKLSSSLYLTYDEHMKKTYGVDYVTYSIRKPIVYNGIISQYQSARYWHSGMLEHFGVIATDNEMFKSDDGGFLIVPFDWKIANDSQSGAKAYERGELANLLDVLSVMETNDSLIPPKDNMVNVVYEKENVLINNSQYVSFFANANYTVIVSPIYQTQDGLENNYIPIEFVSEAFNQNWNSNYLTNEVALRNKHYFAMKLGTRVLPPYIAYHAVGKGDFHNGN